MLFIGSKNILIFDTSMSKKDTKKNKIIWDSLSIQEKLNIDDFLKSWFNGSASLMLSTSGSTGAKKQIEGFKKFMVNSARMTGSFFNFSRETVALHCLPIEFIGGKMMLIRMLEFQMKEIFVSPHEPLDFPENLKIDFAAMTPYQYQKCLAQNKSKLLQIKTVLLGGAAISSELEQTISNLPQRVYHSYGMTETYSHVALREVGVSQYFTALGGVHLTSNNEGALHIDAPDLGVSSLQTNDLVEFVEDGKFRFVGRRDFIINSGGIKISPEALEQQIGTLFKTHNFFIAGLPDAVLGEKVVIFIEGTEVKDFNLFLNALPKYERPKGVVFCEKFSYTKSGKLNRLETLKNLGF